MGGFIGKEVCPPVPVVQESRKYAIFSRIDMKNMALVLAGSIPGEKRFSTYENAVVLTADNQPPCSPCWDYQRAYFDFAAFNQQELYDACKLNGPECMNRKTVDMIANAMKEILL